MHNSVTVTQDGADAKIPDDQCGYTYPEDPEQINPLSRATSCVRDPLPDAGRCRVHAHPTESEYKADRLKANPPDGDALDGAILPAEFADTVDFTEISLLRDADLSEATMIGADLKEANLKDVDLSGAALAKADLSGASLSGANLSEAAMFNANLSGAHLPETDLSGSTLPSADLSGLTLFNADLSGARLPDANLRDADLRDADLRDADLPDANLWEADLSRAILRDADLPGASIEKATVIGVDLFDADLTGVQPYGARIEAVKINDGTEFHSDPSAYARWWQWEGSVLAPPPRCGYDPKFEPAPDEPEMNREGEQPDGEPDMNREGEQSDGEPDTSREELLTKAADTYRQFEELARRNTQPALQSSMFVLRQDMQRKRYWVRDQYGQWFANRVFRAVFKHGESFGRILLTALVIILAFAGVYWQGELILTNPDAVTLLDENRQFINNAFDALYFSTLTFTTLGLGDFQPKAASEVGRALVLLEAALGAILIATFVFVLGRRAAR